MALAIGEVKAGFATDAHGSVVHPENATVVLLPREWGGDVDIPWGRVSMRLGCDFGVQHLRVAVFNEDSKGGGSWRVLPTVTVDSAKPTVLLDPWVGASKVSICRVPQSATDTAASVPVSYLVEAVLKA